MTKSKIEIEQRQSKTDIGYDTVISIKHDDLWRKVQFVMGRKLTTLQISILNKALQSILDDFLWELLKEREDDNTQK